MRLPHPHRPRLTYANVASTLALVVATSTGGAYAAATIGSAQIKDDAVKSRHIAAGNVKTPDLRDGAVTGAKLADGSVSAADLGDGSVGQSKLGADVAFPSAYGTVWWTGSSVTGSRNLSTSNITHAAEGVYCISGLGFTPSTALVSSAYEPNAFHHDVEVYGLMGNFAANAPCPAGTQIQVRVYQPGTTTEDDGNFNIAIF